jgi:hypothetical protein
MSRARQYSLATKGTGCSNCATGLRSVGGRSLGTRCLGKRIGVCVVIHFGPLLSNFRLVAWAFRLVRKEPQLGVNFPAQSQSNASPNALSEFRDIVQYYRHLNLALTNMAEVVEANAGKRDEQIKDDITKLITTLNVEVSGGMTPSLMGVIGEELRLHPESKEVSSSPSPPSVKPISNVVNSQPVQVKPCQFEVRTYIIHKPHRRKHVAKASR